MKSETKEDDPVQERLRIKQCFRSALEDGMICVACNM